jgi:RNA polymerase sigma-70 factor (ECF subfamily)
LSVWRDLTRNWTSPALLEWTVTVVTPREDPSAAASLDDLSDEALLLACRQGSREAFDELVQRYQRPLYRLCFRFAGRHADAGDLVQETFIRAWRGLAGFRGRSSVSTWLYRIAVNVCLSRLSRSAPRVEPLDDRRITDTHAESPSERVLRGEQAVAVRRAIAALPERQRATIILRVYHDLPHREIATILGSSVGSVKANLFHALRNLRRLLEEHNL